MPALLTQMSSRPKRSIVAAKNRFDVFGDADVAGVLLELAAGLLQLCGRLLEAFRPDVAKCQLRALVGEAQGDAAANAATGTRDEGDAVLQEHVIIGTVSGDIYGYVDYYKTPLIAALGD